MKRNPPKTRWSLLVILIIASFATYLGLKYLTPKPESAGIFLVASPDLTYGETTISGVLTKDAPAGKKGSFILVLPDSRPVVLDLTGLDAFLGQNVEVAGMLIPADEISPLMMTVKSIKLQ